MGGAQLGMGFPAQNVPVDAKSLSLTQSNTIFVVEMKEEGWHVIDVRLREIVTVCLHSVVVWGIPLKLHGREIQTLNRPYHDCSSIEIFRTDN